MKPWFRLYHEFSTDPKVQSMSEPMQRRLAMIFCLRCREEIPGLTDEEVGAALRISPEDVTETKSLFVTKRYIDSEWRVTKWNKRQFSSDTSADRTRRYREKIVTSRARHSDGVVTPSDSDSDTESTPPTESYSQTPILSAVADASSADAEGFLFPSPPLEILSSEKKNRPCSVVEERKRWFLEFWQVVWLKTAKGAALKAWLKAATTREMADTIIAAAKVQAPLLREDASRYDHSLIHPATWLNQGRWEDELNMPLPVRVRETASERNGRLREEKFVQRMVDDGLIDPARSQKGD